MRIIVEILATGLFTGYCPLFPGTIATILAALIYWYLLPTNIFIYSIVLLFSIFIALIVSTSAEKRFNNKDDKKIVIDEIVGFWVSLIFLPKTLFVLLIGFILFRIFDVFKLPLIKSTQKLAGGIGIVTDDFLAGLLTNIILQVCRIVSVIK